MSESFTGPGEQLKTPPSVDIDNYTDERFPTPGDLRQKVERILQYPYMADRPEGSFVSHVGENGEVKFTERELTPDDIRDRIPFIAIGSNGSPSVLQDKFGRKPGEFGYVEGTTGNVPVQKIVLNNHDAAFGGTIYNGAIPATMVEVPGSSVESWITWLTPEQVNSMNISEDVEDQYGSLHTGQQPDKTNPTPGRKVDSGIRYEDKFAPLDSYKIAAVDLGDIEETAPGELLSEQTRKLLNNRIYVYATSTGALCNNGGGVYVYDAFERKGGSNNTPGSQKEILLKFGNGLLEELGYKKTDSPEEIAALDLTDPDFHRAFQHYLSDRSTARLKHTQLHSHNERFPYIPAHRL